MSASGVLAFTSSQIPKESSMSRTAAVVDSPQTSAGSSLSNEEAQAFMAEHG
jgi:hypothetical protein